MRTADSSAATSTINFIVWIDDREIRTKARERSAKIAEKYPSRMIFLDACDDAQDADGTLAVNGLAPEGVRDAVLARIVSDVPCVLWWTGSPVGGRPAFDALLAIADAIVVDSSGSNSGDERIRALADFVAANPTIAVRDLAWLRLRPWQDIVAQFFDDSALRQELFCIRQLRIISGSAAEAAYLAGWLASRLGWAATAHDRFTDRGGAEIEFAHAIDGEARRVRSIEIVTQCNVYRAALSPDDETIVMLSTLGTSPQPSRLVPLQMIDNASLIERAILEPATDEVFETSLRVVGTVLG